MQYLILFLVLVLIIRKLVSIYRKKIIDYENISKSTIGINNGIANYSEKHSISKIYHTFDDYNSKKSKIFASLEKVNIIKIKIEKLNKAYIIICSSKNDYESIRQLEVLRYLISQYDKLCVTHLYLNIIVNIDNLEKQIYKKKFDTETFIQKLKDNILKEYKKIMEIDIISEEKVFPESKKAINEIIEYLNNLKNDIALLITHSILLGINPINENVDNKAEILEINIKEKLNEEYDRIFSEIEVNKIFE